MPSAADGGERGRLSVEQALAMIENAKKKALAQREEYGRFLQWKVKMQRRERKQREEEEKALRTRIDAKLKAVLEEHRRQKSEEIERWRNVKPDKKLTLAVPETAGAIAARRQQEAIEQMRREERERKREAIAARLNHPPRSAPAGADGNSPQKGAAPPAAGKSAKRPAKSGYEPAVPREGRAPELPGGQHSGLPSRAPSAAGKSEAGKSEAKSELPVFHSEAEFDAHFALPDVPSPRADRRALEDPGTGGTDPLSPQQRETMRALEQRQHRNVRRARAIKNMYDEAVSRRHYSTARMLADPPADFMIGADLMRYIPADVMGDVDATTVPRPPASPRADAQSHQFFITEDARSAPPGTMTTSSDFADPGEVHRHDGTGQQHQQRKPKGGSRVSRWSTYDPHAWMKTKLSSGIAHPEAIDGGPNPSESATAALVGRPRDREEEAATLEWYKECYEPLTRIKRRTDRFKAHSWQGVGTHKLPPLASARFTD